MPDFNLNDPVYVNRDGKRMEGIVAFTGSVAFAEGDDWVGVRLTGSSAGKGKNDGSVKGQSYFKCPPNCGSFVRSSALEVRKLSKIEELRLRRELASSGIASVSTTSASAISPSGSGATTPTSGPGRQSRLEELRQRRAAISTDRDSSANQEAIDELNKKLKAKDDELASMKESLSGVEKELKETQAKVDTLGTQNSDLKGKLKSQSSSAPAASEDSADMPPAPDTWTREKSMLEDQVIKFEEKIQSMAKQIEKQKSEHSTEVSQLRAESLAYKNELQALTDQTKQKGVSDTSHYKEKAVLQAQIAALKRDVQDLKNEKMDMESTIEDLSLDKSELQEQNEELTERLDELKLDAETAQMEVEELRMELEQAKATAENAGSAVEMNVDSMAGDNAASTTQSDDMAQALSIQNARLREALIRLREQSSLEKMELTRKLKAVEKEAETAKGLVKQSADLENLRTTLEEEVRDLKDMVDQGAAFEGMVEDLSDRLMDMEEQNVSLLTTIRELEEATELTTEMEEVQAEELKAMAKDLEDRDTLIRNFEEAIKMQKKREEDFTRTVGNYRSTVETLKKEKEALMELQEGGEGEKSSLLVSSQKALARAAQLVSDAAEMRKKEAQAALERIEAHATKHLADRLEKLLPKGITGAEIAAIKGELLLSRIAGLASCSLDGIATSFNDNLRLAPLDDDIGGDEGPTDVVLSDESKQDVANVLHQIECAEVLINSGSDAIRYLAAGQWPDLLSEHNSMDLGSYVGHTMSELEVALRSILKSLKEEGVIDTHQSGVDSLRQAANNANIELEKDLKNLQDGSTLSTDWKAPGQELLNCATRVKFSCLGAASAVAVASKSDSAIGAIGSELRNLLKRLHALSADASQACLRLAFLEVKNADMVAKLLAAVELVRTACDKLLEEVRSNFLDGGVTEEGLKKCDEAADLTMKLMSQFSSTLRSLKLNSIEDSEYFHPLSPESNDSWDRVSRLAKRVRAIDGDEEDVNFAMRATHVEQRLSEAINNEPKLSLANAKVASLEKSVVSRSREIAMQNARLSELENMLTKSSAQPSPVKINKIVKSSEELNQLKEENRMLMEAMDVLQEQVAGYENEIRMLNTMKSPGKRAGAGKQESRRSVVASAANKRAPSLRNLGAQTGGAADTSVASSAAVGALEAALFRPAVTVARREAAKWKNIALSKALLELPPLAVPGMTLDSAEEESKDNGGRSDPFENLSRLSAAISSFRIQQASMRVVDLEESKGRSRADFRAKIVAQAARREDLDTAAASAKRCLSQYGGASSGVDNSSRVLLGKVKLHGREPHMSFPAVVSKDDLYRMNLHVVR